MNIQKLFTSEDPYFISQTLFRLEEEGRVTYVVESVFTGPIDDDLEKPRPAFEVVRPEFWEASQDLRSFLEAVRSGEADTHPLSTTQRHGKRRHS